MSELIKVSRSSFFKARFEVTEDELRSKLKGDELEEALKTLPSEDELEFYKIFKSQAPELERAKRKMSVCLDAEVTELRDDYVEYLYAGKKVGVKSPSNAFAISQALEAGKHSAVELMMQQVCIRINSVPLMSFDGLGVDEINLLVSIINKFFFQPYL